ncbi:hypothetical protein ACFPM3_20650 [Streptomyces coeruleoprunus]|uniref:Uncharacterized protein n=1 Tax=Streptomyces coeruleoprunus TaxID=285563 RepID=A0ABV9XHR4_9ACTN
MPSTSATSAARQSAGLVRGRRAIAAARGRNATPADGGGTGRTDTND